MYKDQKITKAEYFDDYKLKISFSDGATNIFDFKNLVTSDREEYMPYLDITKFKKFKIQKKVNCIAWGKNIDMQMPGFILYSEKRPSVGWTKNETIAELKKRLPKKFYYEMFVDNNIWAGILVIIELLNEDKQVDLFSAKFNKGTGNKNYVFEVYIKEAFVLKIQLQPMGLVYDLMVKNIGSVFYKVNFKNDIIGKDLTGRILKKYDTLFIRVRSLIKKDRDLVETRFGAIQ